MKTGFQSFANVTVAICCSPGEIFYELFFEFGEFLVTNLLYNTILTDMETCYKVFTREVAGKLDLKANGWGFDPEITAQILLSGYRIYEVPISYSGREFDEGKKISWRDGFTVLWTLIKYRILGYRHPGARHP